MSGDASDNSRGGRSFQVRRRFARICVLQILYQMDLGKDWDIGEADLELFWNQLQENGEMPPLGDRINALKKDVRRMVMGAVERRATIDELIVGAAANWKLERMNVVDRNILRLGVFEMQFCDKTPPAVAINEAIELAKEYGDRESPAFINGILDKLKKAAKPAESAAAAEPAESAG